MKTVEVNFDGIIGPTHNYSGLAIGDIASEKNAHKISSPLAAVQQGLDKMHLLMQLGIPQAVLPPHPRPNSRLLSSFGFSGSDEKILKKAQRDAPQLFAACYSASSMWTANAATVSPSADTQDGKVHFTPANLMSNLHRAQESETTATILKTIFNDERFFSHHPPLAPSAQLSDEGAANHLRICQNYHDKGIELFVFGRYAFDKNKPAPIKYPARQSEEASQLIATLHQLNDRHFMLAQQNPEAIDHGVFHNDVIVMSNKDVLIMHESAFLDTNDVAEKLKSKFDGKLNVLVIKDEQITLDDAVNSYFFNSQLVSISDREMVLIAPKESEENKNVRMTIDDIIQADNPIKAVHYVDCRQSMQNGGGPACLRLRVVLNENEFSACHQGVLLDEKKLLQLKQWADKHYREQLAVDDLVDPSLITESYTALDELTQLLQLGAIYDFQ